jgi:tetratricopeptide (TPR) repeat protein
MEASLELALATNSPFASRAANNLGITLWIRGDVARWRELLAESERLAKRVRDATTIRWAQYSTILENLFTGRWDDALESANQFIAMCESGHPHYHEVGVRGARSEVRLGRGDAQGALEDVERLLGLARGASDRQSFLPALKVAARAYATLGHLGESRSVTRELLAAAEAPGQAPLFYFYPLWPVTDSELVEEVRALYASVPPSPWRDAQLAVLDGDFSRAAAFFACVGYRGPEAEVHLLAAETLIGNGRRAEGEGALQKALAFHRSVGATFYVQRGEALLAETA